MADIDIIPKRRSGNVWLWIVIALVVVAALWFALANRHDGPPVGLADEKPPAVAALEAIAFGQG